MIMIMSKSISALFATGRAIPLKAGQNIFWTGDRVRRMYLVTEGQIDLVRHSKTGARLILNRVGPGSVLAEASAYSETYHCDGAAVCASELRSLSVSEFREELHGAPDLTSTWAAQLARDLQKARLQSEIRTLKTVAERLDAWLGTDNALPPKGQIQDLAHMLGVTREALYRELSRRRRR